MNVRAFMLFSLLETQRTAGLF